MNEVFETTRKCPRCLWPLRAVSDELGSWWECSQPECDYVTATL